MSDRTDSELDWEAALRAAKLESLAEFAAGAGHEINNPVATIVGRVQLLLPGESDPERRRSLLAIGGQALRIRDMIGDLMLFARPPIMHPVALRAADAVAEVVNKLRSEPFATDIRIETDLDTDVVLWADPIPFQVVVGALVRNACEASSPGGTVRVSLDAPLTVKSTTPELSDPDVCLDVRPQLALLTVRDHGRGLTETDREHLFDPFYSGRQAGRGLGFGLCKCWRIVTLHHGQITAESTPDPTTTFTIRWPLAPPGPTSVE